ncbi:MAG: RICIN domain-containing protein, partial [Chthoniobacteraceae bacterium]
MNIIRYLTLPARRNVTRIPRMLVALAAVCGASHSFAEDWGAYSIVPASAPAMVLESTGAADAGAVVSIGKAVGAVNQKWVITPKGENLFSIKPASNPALALAVEKGAAKMGSAIVLEADKGEPWQLWSLSKHENGSYSLVPKHAPDMGLDDLGGKQTPGSKIDLWTNTPNDQHLQWFIRPLAGSAVAAASEAADVPKYEPPVIKPEDILPGTTMQFTFTKSAIFPGTVRDVTVFIPAQYDAAKPACVYVKTDGYNP